MNSKGETNLERISLNEQCWKRKGKKVSAVKVYGTKIRSVKGKKIAHWKRVILLDFPNNCLIYWYYGLVEFFYWNVQSGQFNSNPNFIFPSPFSFAILLWYQMDFWIASLFGGQEYMWCTSLHFFVFNLEKPENPLIHYLICSRCS